MRRQRGAWSQAGRTLDEILLRSAWAGTLCALGIGCTPTTEYAATSDYVPPPKQSKSDVEVVLSAPTRPYIEVGLLSVEQSSAWDMSGDETLPDALKEEGARRGCDAVWLSAKTTSVVGSVTTGANGQVVGGITSLDGYKAICIAYTAGTTTVGGQANEVGETRGGEVLEGSGPVEVSGFSFGMDKGQAKGRHGAAGPWRPPPRVRRVPTPWS